MQTADHDGAHSQKRKALSASLPHSLDSANSPSGAIVSGTIFPMEMPTVPRLGIRSAKAGRCAAERHGTVPLAGSLKKATLAACR